MSDHNEETRSECAKRHVLSVVMLNTLPTYIALVHENQHRPYERRIVQIKLTDEQVAQIAPRKVGQRNGQDCFEELGDVWLEVQA